jgi:acyl dehydratase
VTYRAGAEDIAAFARAVGELHAMHFDRDAAVAAGFADVVAPPMFAAVYAGRAFRSALDDPELAVDRSRTVHGGQRFRWGAPAIAGDELTATARLSDERVAVVGRILEFETITRNQRGELVVTGTWSVIERG